jgi:hypothetical protein
MTALMDDVRQAFRVLANAPGFAAASLCMLALAIDANTAIFTVIDAVILRPLPFPQAERLVRISADLTGRGARQVGVAAQELFDYQQQGDLFAAVSGEYPINANLTGSDQPERSKRSWSAPPTSTCSARGRAWAACSGRGTTRPASRRSR